MKSAKKEEIKLTPEGEKIVKKATLESEKAYKKLMSKPTVEDATESLRKIAEDAVEKKMKKPKVELVSYSMKMVIPTGNYANIQPEIVVRAGTVEEAHDYIAPHFNKLWKEYYLVGERRPEPVKPSGVPIVSPETTPGTNPMPPASSVAFTKASQAIASCLSHRAMDVLKNQVAISPRLTPEDKEKLQPLIVERIASGQLTE